jgi:hypothetical protein
MSSEEATETGTGTGTAAVIISSDAPLDRTGTRTAAGTVDRLERLGNDVGHSQSQHRQHRTACSYVNDQHQESTSTLSHMRCICFNSSIDGLQNLHADS